MHDIQESRTVAVDVIVGILENKETKIKFRKMQMAMHRTVTHKRTWTAVQTHCTILRCVCEKKLLETCARGHAVRCIACIVMSA